MNKTIQTKLEELPTSPGVYFHKSASGEIIYVGKAAVLRNRVRQYFQASRNLDAKTMALVSEIADIDWQETESEIDALFLESEMVKRYMPRYNILLRDDRSQSFVRIDMKSEWPTVTLTRNPADDSAEYVGPFYNGFALKKALRYLRRVFPYFERPPSERDSRLESQIGLTPDRSRGADTYRVELRKLMSYIRGNRKALTRELEVDMKQAAQVHDFEKAAHLRNQLRALRELQQRVYFGDREFLDISKDQALGQLSALLSLPHEPRRIEGYDISHLSGSDVVASMVVFSNGTSDRAEYRKFKVVQLNDDYANMHEVIARRMSRQRLKQWEAPDLVLIDGGKGQLDAALTAMREREVAIPAIAIAKREEEMVVRTSDFGISPSDDYALRFEGDYTIINLHPGQRNASSHSKNLRAQAGTYPYDALIKLFQRIRDEAHRFAVSYHTTVRKRRTSSSQLDGIPGIGPKTRSRLLRTFGSVRALGSVNRADLAAEIGDQKAAILYAHLHPKTEA